MSVRTDRAKERARVHIGNHHTPVNLFRPMVALDGTSFLRSFPVRRYSSSDGSSLNLLAVPHFYASMIVIGIMPVPISYL